MTAETAETDAAQVTIAQPSLDGHHPVLLELIIQQVYQLMTLLVKSVMQVLTVIPLESPPQQAFVSRAIIARKDQQLHIQKIHTAQRVSIALLDQLNHWIVQVDNIKQEQVNGSVRSAHPAISVQRKPWKSVVRIIIVPKGNLQERPAQPEVTPRRLLPDLLTSASHAHLVAIAQPQPLTVTTPKEI